MKLLRHSPAHIIAVMMVESHSLGVNPDNYSATASPTQWPIYDSGEPNVPDNVITVYDTQGVEDGRAMVTGELFDHFGIQIRVRSKDHVTGWTKANAIRATLAESTYQESVTIESIRYLIHAVSRISNVIILGKEMETEQNRRASKRNLFTINCLASIKEF